MCHTSMRETLVVTPILTMLGTPFLKPSLIRNFEIVIEKIIGKLKMLHIIIFTVSLFLEALNMSQVIDIGN